MSPISRAPRAALPLLLLGLLLTTAACDSGESGVVTGNSTVTVAYIGTLQDGRVFDQSDSATFSLNGVIPGFRFGLIGMTIGETKTFDIAPEDGYGANPPQGSIIPPNATLTFEVTVLDIR